MQVKLIQAHNNPMVAIIIQSLQRVCNPVILSVFCDLLLIKYICSQNFLSDSVFFIIIW